MVKQGNLPQTPKPGVLEPGFERRWKDTSVSYLGIKECTSVFLLAEAGELQG